MGSGSSKYPPFDVYNQPWMYDPRYVHIPGSKVGKAYLEAMKNGGINEQGGPAVFGDGPTNNPFGGVNNNSPFGGGNHNSASWGGPSNNAGNVADPWMANDNEFDQATNTPYTGSQAGGLHGGPSIFRFGSQGSRMPGGSQFSSAGLTQFSHPGDRGSGRHLNPEGHNDVPEPGGQTMGGVHVRGYEGESVYSSSGYVNSGHGATGFGSRTIRRTSDQGGSERRVSVSNPNRDSLPFQVQHTAREGSASNHSRGTSRGNRNTANTLGRGNLSTISERNETLYRGSNAGASRETQTTRSGRQMQENDRGVRSQSGQTLVGLPSRGVRSETAGGTARDTPRESSRQTSTNTRVSNPSTVVTLPGRNVGEMRGNLSTTGQTVAGQPLRGVEASLPGRGSVNRGSTAATITSEPGRRIDASERHIIPSSSGQTLAGRTARGVEGSSSGQKTSRHGARGYDSSRASDGRSRY